MTAGPDFGSAIAFRWREGRLQPITHPSATRLDHLLGIDPLYVANEGRCVVILPAAQDISGRTPRRLNSRTASREQRN